MKHAIGPEKQGEDPDRSDDAVGRMAEAADSVPAPLYRDPVYDGAADPVLVWNPGEKAWWMLYTQRRAKLDLPGVEWVHGTEIGVARSRDLGMTWTYLGTLPLAPPDPEYSFWAPDVIRDDAGRFHILVSYVPGAAKTHRSWGGPQHILHYSSDDLRQWKFEGRVPLASDICIDATLIRRPDGSWRMWYKDEGNHKTNAVESRDLKEWAPVKDPGVSKLGGEGPKVFRFKDHYWMIKDPSTGLDVYRSDDLETWAYQGKILDKPGTRNSDGTVGKHADVVVCGERAYIIYFTHPYTEDAPERNGVSPLSNRHTAIQAAELEVRDGRLLCDRDKPFRIHLTPPQERESVRYSWKQQASGITLYAGEAEIGHVERLEADGITAKDQIREISRGVFEWKRVFHLPETLPANPRLAMAFVANWSPAHWMIPAVSYDGNPWGRGKEPKGMIQDGHVRSLAYHRTAVPGATYSEGTAWSFCLFGKTGADVASFSCSISEEGQQTRHELIWPEEESPQVYVTRDTYGPAYRGRLDVKAGGTFESTAYLVVSRAEPGHKGRRKFLDAAWKMNYRPPSPQQAPELLWRWGVTYAKESLWTEDGVFRGFAMGVGWEKGGWKKNRTYEIGWCGQNGSLAVSLLADYLKTEDPESLDKGLLALDTWASHAVLPNGLFRCHFGPILANQTDDLQDAANLGAAAMSFFAAFDMAERCGVQRPRYREVALGICDFAVRAEQPDGRLGKSWRNNGEVADPEGTIGCFLVPPMVKAYQVTGDEKYLRAAEKAYAFYYAAMERDGFTTAGALDTYCIDKESAMPLLTGGLALYDATMDRKYIDCAEAASYYLATWQWHYSTPFPEGTALAEIKYDTFGGTSVSVQHHHQDPYALHFFNAWLKLAELTGKLIWRQRALALWANATAGVSDGNLMVMGQKRPTGGQDEGAFHTRWGDTSNVSLWLVAWPGAFRMEALRQHEDWAIFQAATGGDDLAAATRLKSP